MPDKIFDRPLTLRTQGHEEIFSPSSSYKPEELEKAGKDFENLLSGPSEGERLAGKPDSGREAAGPGTASSANEETSNKLPSPAGKRDMRERRLSRFESKIAAPMPKTGTSQPAKSSPPADQGPGADSLFSHKSDLAEGKTQGVHTREAVPDPKDKRGTLDLQNKTNGPHGLPQAVSLSRQKTENTQVHLQSTSDGGPRGAGRSELEQADMASKASSSKLQFKPDDASAHREALDVDRALEQIGGFAAQVLRQEAGSPVQEAPPQPGTLPKAVQEIVSRVLTTAQESQQPPEVRIQLDDRFLENTEIIISKHPDGMVEVRFLTSSDHSTRLLSPHLGDLENRLSDQLSTPVRVSLQNPETRDQNEGRSRQRRFVWEEME